jgi:vanillate O-demethylase ferredoxin subunit
VLRSGAIPERDGVDEGQTDSMVGKTMEVLVKRISYEAETINSYELIDAKGNGLVPFTAGSHIDLHLSNGLIRSYSLINHQNERNRYVIAVNKETTGRGGSAHIHETVRAGDILTISHPRNNFVLQEDAAHSVLIAGGIGITPLLAMVRRLDELGRSWELFYAARTRAAAAFLDELNRLGAGGRAVVHLNFDRELSGRMLDLSAVVRGVPSHAHLYCCGPASMLDAFAAATADRSPDHVHVEYFKAREKPATEGGFEVRLARSKRTIVVRAGQTILEALLDAGIAANYACTEGVCGTCETRVLEGLPHHRDMFLSKEEQQANATMMICCSGAKSRTLTLDI